jgi:hypothetical protein
VAQALERGVDRTLLIASPVVASTILTEWVVAQERGRWIFGPTLQTPGFLQNVPFEALDGTLLLSPTLSLTSECDAHERSYRGPSECTRDNEAAFRAAYSERWDGDVAFPAAHFYYDAVVLLAMGLEYASTNGNDEPSAAELHDAILELLDEEAPTVKWKNLDDAWRRLSRGEHLNYAGAAAEYDLDKFGAAEHSVFDTWHVGRQQYVSDGSLFANCYRASTAATE